MMKNIRKPLYSYMLSFFLLIFMFSACDLKLTKIPEGRIVSDSEYALLSEKYFEERDLRKDLLSMKISLPKYEFQPNEIIYVSVNIINVSNEKIIIRRPDADTGRKIARTESISPLMNREEILFIVSPIDTPDSIFFPFQSEIADDFGTQTMPEEFHILEAGESYQAQIQLPLPLSTTSNIDTPYPFGKYSLSLEYSNIQWGANFIENGNWISIDYNAWIGKLLSNEVLFEIVQ